MDVFFDEIEVQHERLVWQENAYYPFGLAIKPLEREGRPDHRWLYNEMNEREKATGWDETKFRTYDYQIGRFNHVDPKAEMASQEVMTPYHYSFNNPIRYNDPNGDCPNCLVGAVTGALVEVSTQLLVNHATGSNAGIDWGDVVIATVEGGVTGGAGAGKNALKAGVRIASAFAQAGVDVNENGLTTVGTDEGDKSLDQFAVEGVVGSVLNIKGAKRGEELGTKLSKGTDAKIAKTEKAFADNPTKSGTNSLGTKGRKNELKLNDQKTFSENIKTFSETGVGTATSSAAKAVGNAYSEAKEWVSNLFD